jgi:hypothetical protein
VRAGVRGLGPGDLGEQRLDVAAAHQVEVLALPPLLGEALARVARHALRERAVHLEPRVPGLLGHLLRRLGRRLRGVLMLLLLLLLLLLLGGSPLGGRLQ